MLVERVPNKVGLQHLLKELVLLYSLCIVNGLLLLRFKHSISFLQIGIGLLSFQFFEYFLHRCLFHLKSDVDSVKKLVFKIHGIHHKEPQDQSFYKTSPLTKLAGVAIINLIIGIIIGIGSFNFFIGFISGYGFYLLVHFVIHHYQPPNNIFRFFWDSHDVHHYINAKKGYAISNPFIDFLFMTQPSKEECQKLKRIPTNIQ